MKYYICKLCGRLTNDIEISEECSRGGQPSCNCQYMQLSWDTSYQKFEPIYLRYWEELHEIPANIFEYLAMEPNTVKRLWMLATVPDEELKT